jgi:hypothetical protein
MAESFNVDFSELEKLEVIISSNLDSMKKNAVSMLQAIGYQIHADAVEMISRGPARHGTEYIVDGKSATRSAWGEPAKTDTGNLVSSLHHALQGDNEVSIGYLEAVAPYGLELEDAAQGNRKVLEPVTSQNESFIQALVAKLAKQTTTI